MKAIPCTFKFSLRGEGFATYLTLICKEHVDTNQLINPANFKSLK